MSSTSVPVRHTSRRGDQHGCQFVQADAAAEPVTAPGPATERTNDMQYLLMIGADEETAEQAMAAGDFGTFEAWMDDLQRRGALRVHAGLHKSQTATTVRVRNGEVLLTDGPFMEGREQVGGLALIECADLDEAIDIAARHPATS